MNFFMLAIGIGTFAAAGWSLYHRNYDFATIYTCWAVADILIARRG